jgi:organic radical activating enzyme
MYQVAERFKSIQGEGLFTGTPMAFIRFVGCSVGKKICTHCDTDFEKPLGWLGGGEYSADDLAMWSLPHDHICLTGGEPFDQDLEELATALYWKQFHIETSGTKEIPSSWKNRFEAHICVSPKPGFIEEVVLAASEVKVIVPGLGTEEGLKALQTIGRGLELASPLIDRDNFRWPDLNDALRWANAGKIVFLQPRNGKFDINHINLSLCQELVATHPNLRLSTQTHKLLKVR